MSDVQCQVQKAILVDRRRVIVHALARTIYEQLALRLPAHRSETDEAVGWIRIESLSQLRTIVGGRFQNLKSRWVAAGFPLRAHRGDRTEEACIDEAAWVELQAWLGSQGFEARLVAEESSCFELRKKSRETV